MSVEAFIDTNVFLYHLDPRDAKKHAVAERIVRDAVAERNACISFQVVQECLNVVLRKAEIRLDAAGAELYLESVLGPLYKIPSSIALYQRGLELHARYRYGFYDSLIIAAALDAGCTRLLTEDMHDGQQIDKLTIVNPFKQDAVARKPARRS